MTTRKVARGIIAALVVPFVPVLVVLYVFLQPFKQGWSDACEWLQEKGL